MAKLVYSAITSLDGYTADATGDIEWSTPDPEVFAFINDIERTFGTFLYGRRMYEAMLYWETFDPAEDDPPFLGDFARLWRAADKVAYSTALGAVSSAGTRVERWFDPATVARMKEATARDLSIGGPHLAGQAMAAGLVDEMHLFVTPLTLGGGTPALTDRVRVRLELPGADRFGSGVVHLHYRIGG